MRPSTVAEALKVLEWAGVLTWQHRITRIREHCRDLFSRESWRWRVVRTSNAYVFNDPLQRAGGLPASKSENPTGTPNQEVSSVSASQSVPARNLSNALERALQSLRAAIGAKAALNRSAIDVPAT